MSFGHLRSVSNMDRRSPLANTCYQRVMVVGPNGIETLLITPGELERIRERVAKNPEDTQMIPSWWDRLCAAFSGLFESRG